MRSRRPRSSSRARSRHWRMLPDILIADFEGDDYGVWTVEGTAFGRGPARGTLPGQMSVEGFQGRGLVNSFAGGDGSTGRLTSLPCTIDRRSIHFLIGGGGITGETCLNLIIDGKVGRTAVGPDTEPGGSRAPRARRVGRGRPGREDRPT